MHRGGGGGGNGGRGIFGFTGPLRPERWEGVGIGGLMGEAGWGVGSISKNRTSHLKSPKQFL